MTAASVGIRRVYEQPGADEGLRVLVDRLWPRGLTKEKVGADVWAKDAAPSAELRTWWDHDPERFHEFAERYRAELEQTGEARALAELLEDAPHVTLLYAAKDPQVNHAVVLADAVLTAREGSGT